MLIGFIIRDCEVCYICSNSLSQLMNATSSADVDLEDREAQTSCTDSLLTTMRQVHSQIEQLEVGCLAPSILTFGWQFGVVVACWF